MKERRLFSRHSIGTRIAALFMLLILVITAVMTYVSISVLTNELLDNATEYTEQLIRRINAELDMYVEYMKDISDFIVDNGSIGKTHARVFEHALAETSLAAQPDRRAVDLGHRRQEPVRSGLRLFIPAGGEGHGKAQKQKCKNFLHFDINMLFLVF